MRGETKLSQEDAHRGIHRAALPFQRAFTSLSFFCEDSSRRARVSMSSPSWMLELKGIRDKPGRQADRQSGRRGARAVRPAADNDIL